jgi:hypothetical protein
LASANRLKARHGNRGPRPEAVEPMRDEIARRTRATVDAGRTIGRALGAPAAARAAAGGSLWRLVRTGLSAAPDVLFNERSARTAGSRGTSSTSPA